MMIFFRLSFCAAALGFAQCSHTEALESGDAVGERAAGTGSPETVDLTLALTPTFGAPPAAEPPPEPVLPPAAPVEPVKVKPARVAKAKTKSSQPAKPSAEVVKASSLPIPPMPKTKEPAEIDRSKLLNLMREPTER